MLRNLKAEMTRSGVCSAALARTIHKSDRAVRDKLAGKTEFTVSDAILLRDTLFPSMSLEYLFNQTK